MMERRKENRTLKGKKPAIALLLLLSASLVFSGCGGKKPKAEAGNTSANETAAVQANQNNAGDSGNETGANQNSGQNENTVDVEIVSGTSSENAPKDQGSSEVWILASAKVEDNKITIEGTTNLLPGVEIEAEIDAAGYTMFGYQEKTEINNDGTFSMEIKRPDIDKGNLDASISFLPENQDSVLEPYGEKGEKLTGNYIHQEEYDDSVYRKAMTFIRIDANAEAGSEWKSENPIGEKPSDYGDPAIWIKPEVTAEDEYYLIKGKSNLLEGTVLSGDVDIPGYIHFGYGENAEILPDGSFTLRIKKPKDKVGAFYLILEAKPDEDWPKAVAEVYGKLGENFKGDLVKTDQTDEGQIKYIELKMKVDPAK